MNPTDFDVVAESIRVVESGTLAAAPMTRRHRWQPVALHADDGLAIALFARRSRRRSWYEGAVLARSSTGSWAEHDRFWQQGPVGAHEAHDPSGRRNHCVRAQTLSLSESRFGGVSWVAVQVTDVVAEVEVGRGAQKVGPHGRVVAVWSGRRIPHVVFRDARGKALTTLRANRTGLLRRVRRRHRRPPWRWFTARPRQTYTYRSGWGWKFGRRG